MASTNADLPPPEPADERPTPPSAPADLIRARAARLGFDDVGFARATDPGESERLREWLARGYHGSMQYMERVVERRADVTVEHDWARTVICLVRSYAPDSTSDASALESPNDSTGALVGRVASYALGIDYHEWLRRDVRALATFLHDELGARTRIAVDTAPILERPYAREAGLGWIGKNTLLLSRSLGSLTFLAEILVDLELPTGQRSKDHCGSCRACLDVCPTDAFPEPYVLDARRCISYLTIEHRGVIDRDLRAGMGSWIFGCDLCQDVCPWNKFAQPTTAADAKAASDLTAPDLIAYLELDADAFRARFRHSPIWRAGRDGFLRNVAIALGNSRSEGALDPLAKSLEDPSWLVRLHVAWAIGELSSGREWAGRARTVLEHHELREQDARVAEEIRLTLQRL